jgi:hypothetical protein
MSNLNDDLQTLETLISKAQQDLERQQQFKIDSEALFSRNLQAFEQYYPDIATAIKAFKPREDFNVFVTTSGVGNFIPAGSDVPMYSDDPLAQTRQQIERNTERGYYSLTQYGFNIVNTDHRIHSQYMAKLDSHITRARLSQQPLLSKLPEHFPSAMLFGVGLGYAVTLLLEQHSFDYLFISEPNLETFYASLFCTDWAAVIRRVDESGNTLFLQIGLSHAEFFNAIFQVATDIGAYAIIRVYCYQHYPSVEVNEQIKEFFARYYEIQAGFGFYNDAITGLSHCLMNYKNGAEFLLLPDKRKYLDMPAVVVGNGPSLDEAIAVLKEIQDEVIILAAGTAVGSLAKAGIKPDFHVLVERPKSTYDALLDTCPVDYYADLNLLAVDVMYPDVIGLYQWAGLGLKGPEAATIFTQLLSLQQLQKVMPSLPYAGPLVANTALSFACLFGFKEIYLMGVTNGYLQDKSHSSLSIYQSNKNYQNIVDKGANFPLKGNLDQDVRATKLLKLAHLFMEKLIAMDTKQQVYNVGQGAFIKGALPLYPDDVFITKASRSKAEVIELLKSQYFVQPSFVVTDADLAFEQFDELCDHLNLIASEPFTDRQQASDLLKRQARYVFAFRNTKLSHLYNLVKGALLYFHCPMLTSLYLYEDDEFSLQLFADCLAVWRDYVNEMKLDYRRSWNQKCDWGMDMEFKYAP